MRKAALIFAIALLGFPVLVQTALMETELSYKPRTAKGMHSLGTFLGGTGAINLVNGNLVYQRQIVSRPGRAGFSLNLSIYYNSKIWDRDANGMSVKDTGSSVGIGWYLGFARLVQGTATYAIIFPDGSSHEIQQFDDGVWKTVDSTYILYDVNTKTATLKGGAKMVFGNTVGNISYMTEMKDRNGNQITATYVTGTGKLDEVYDALGKAAEFHYTNSYLDSVDSYGKIRTTIYFATSDIGSNPLIPSFSVSAQVPANERKLDSIIIALPDQNIVQDYNYHFLGEIDTISNRIVKDGLETSNVLAKFEFDTREFSDSNYTQVPERVVTSKKEYTSNTQFYISTLAYKFNGILSNPSKTTVADIRGITEYSFGTSTYPARSWSDGLIINVQRKDPNRTKTYQEEATRWEQDIPNVSYLVNPHPIRKTTTLDDGKSFKTKLSYTDDGTGNIRRVSQHKYDSDEILRSTTVHYLHEANPAYATAHMTNLPALISITDESGEEAARTRYVYDEYPLTVYPEPIFNHDAAYNGQTITVRGNRTSVKNRLIEEGRFLVTASHYDAVGNVVSVTDPKNNPPTIRTYGSETNYVLPQYTTNALGHQIQQTWRQYEANGIYYNGDLESITDPNGAQVFYWYDQLGRKLLEITPFETKVFGFDDSSFLATAISSSGTQYGVTDLGGNPIQSVQSDPNGASIVTTTGYDNPWQQPSTVSFPYREGASATNATITYDPMGRKLTETIPGVGVASYLYIGNATTVTDPEGRKKKYIYNEMGSVEKLYEQDDKGNLTVLTKYKYNALGKLVQIIQVGQGNQPNQKRSFDYDSLGRLVSEIFPESGKNLYTYDDNGNVKTKTDARGVVATSKYDALNRRTETTFSDGTPSAAYVYDETGSDLIGLITNGKGKMTSAWTSDGIGYSWTYDIGGRATQQMAFIDGNEYSLGFSYSDDGCGCSKKDLRRITYPDGFSVNYDRDYAGRATAVYQDPSLIYAQYAYNSPNGSLSRIQWGDGFIQEFAFDSKGTLQQDRITDSRDGSFINWEYAYNGNSQISEINERVYKVNPSSDEQARFAYGYDQLRRLASATHAIYDGLNYVPDQINSFTYDQFGNMLSNKLVYPLDPGRNWQSTFNVDASNNRLMSYMNNQDSLSIAYDATGNMLSEGAKSYAYDGAGRMTNAGPDAGVYRYDALGRRVKKTYVYQDQTKTANGSIVSIYGPGNELFVDYHSETGVLGAYNVIKDYVVNGGQAIAKRVVSEGSSAITKYLHRNHMSQVYDPTTYTVDDGLSSMQGKPYSSGGDDQFPGHKDDPESGLHYNLARSYDPDVSRWTSVDSLNGHAYDPQSLNKYSYVRNDPVNMVDPDGRDGMLICEDGTMAYTWQGCVPYSFFAYSTNAWWIQLFIDTSGESSVTQTIQPVPPSNTSSGGLEAAEEMRYLLTLKTTPFSLECETLFQNLTFGVNNGKVVSGYDIKQRASQINIIDASTSSYLYKDLYEFSSVYSSASGQYGNQTVYDVMQASTSTNRITKAAAKLDGYLVFINAPYWGNGGWDDWYDLIHEITHNITGAADQELMGIANYLMPIMQANNPGKQNFTFTDALKAANCGF